MPTPSLQTRLLRHLELYLTAAGLLVIVLVPQLFATESQILAAAVTAALVGVVHGGIFWAVRRRQRLMRELLIADVQGMLKDRINNRLQAMLLHAESAEHGVNPRDRAPLQDVFEAAKEISALLDVLSLESLSHWQTRYPQLKRLSVDR